MNTRAVISSVIVALLVSTPINGQLSCYVQTCLNCGDTSVVGTATTCTFDNAVSMNSLSGSLTAFNTVTTTADANFACLKYVSSNSTSLPHVLRGCIRLTQIDIVIPYINTEQAALGRSVESSLCYDNNCNSAIANGPILSLLLMGLFAKLLL